MAPEIPHQWQSPLTAAAHWRDTCLLGDRSVLEPDTEVWTLADADALDRCYIQNLDAGEGTFFEKLEIQLSEAPASAVKLAAEMLWVLYLFPTPEAMKGATKRLQIRKVWEWSGDGLAADHPALHAPLDQGRGHPGTAFNTHRWRELYFVIRFVQAIKRLGRQERGELLSDPWRFAEWLERVDYAKGRQFRHIVLHLLYPDTFEGMASRYHKQNVVEAFYREWGEKPALESFRDRTGLDREVKRVRERLQEERGEKVDFYAPDLREVWFPEAGDSGPGDGDGTGRSGRTKHPPSSWRTFSKAESAAWLRERFGEDTKVWLIGAGPGGRLWPDFQREGVIRIGWEYMGDLSAYDSRESLETTLAEHPSQSSRPRMNALACWEFAHEMKEGDVVVAKHSWHALLGWGRITSDYRFDDTREDFPHLREVVWEWTGPLGIPEDRRISAKALTRFDPYPEWLRSAFHAMEEGTPPLNGEQERRLYTEEDALEGLFLEPSELTSILDMLARKKAVVLEGPPGVGKSFIARRVAYALIGQKAPERVGLVQFHQSYSYEDFVQGLRPATNGGFERRDGVFLRFCRRAREHPKERFVLIIDEINRANLSRIFGELLLLLEADKRGPEYAVSLTYSREGEEPFFIPENLHVLGLMNTADRSLAMVDYALRRRFAFLRLEPAFGRESFSEYLLDAGVEEELILHLEQVMKELNREIAQDARSLGRGFEIGHAFFVPTKEDDDLGEGWFRAVVQHEIAPLLREYWFDDEARAKQWVSRLLGSG